jgi:hypothetical protein
MYNNFKLTKMKKKYIVLGIFFLGLIVTNYSISNQTKVQSLLLANIEVFASANAEGYSDCCDAVQTFEKCSCNGTTYLNMVRK